MKQVLPRYPVYVPSKGRYEQGQTIKVLIKDKCPFYLVVEESEAEEYGSRFPEAELLVLPFEGQRLKGARNWIKRHSIEELGAKRHWQLDDNMRSFRRMVGYRRIPCRAGIALRVCEDFTDRYTNIAVSGLNYYCFVMPGRDGKKKPFQINSHVYSCSLVNNELPFVWEEIYNDDTDYCLQVLAGGYCTILLNAFMCDKMATMQVKGGNTEDLYQYDGRLKMARALERKWPYIVKTSRRFNRPQHVVHSAWMKFDTPLIRRDDLDWEAIEKGGSVEYGMKLKQIRPAKGQRNGEQSLEKFASDQGIELAREEREIPNTPRLPKRK